MDESDFFTFLEYRVCDEIPAMRRREILGLWCDGLSSERDEISNGRCAIHGQAWMGGGAWKAPKLQPSGGMAILRDPPRRCHALAKPRLASVLSPGPRKGLA